MKVDLGSLQKLPLSIKKGERVFLQGDLGAGKTTLARHILGKVLGIKGMIKSPTYVYYNKYGDNIFHFDLYRVNAYEEFINIGGEEIFDNPDNICIVEWPEILRNRYEPSISIRIEKVDWNEDERNFVIEDRNQ